MAEGERPVQEMTDREIAEETLVRLRALQANQEKFRDVVVETIQANMQAGAQAQQRRARAQHMKDKL